jgi:uncharacterized protein involved in response to NO
MLPEYYHLVLAVSGTGWIVAFGLFALEYAPMLVTPRMEKKSAGLMRRL